MSIEETTATAAEEVAAPDPEALDPGSPPAAEEATPEITPPAAELPGAPAEEASPAPTGDDATLEAAPPAPESSVVRQSPWGFRVDGSRVDPPGAYRTDDGLIHIPEDVWEQQIRPKYTGDRSVWQRERARYEQQLKALSDENRPEIIRANTFAERMLAIVEMEDPTERDEALEKLRRDIPILEARAEAEAAKRQAEAYRGEVTERQQEELTQTVVPILQEQLSDYLRRAVNHPRLKDAGLDPQELQKALWEEFGPTGLFVDAEDAAGADFETPAGLVAYQAQRIDRYLLQAADLIRRGHTKATSEVEQLRKELAEVKAAAAIAAKNATNLAPTDPKKTPPVVAAAGAPGAASEQLKPWHNPKLSREEQKALFAEHMRGQGVVI